MVTMERLLTRSDVAERLACSVHKAGELMCQMDYITLGGTGGHKRVTEAALAAWVEQHTTRQTVGLRPRKNAKNAVTRIPRWEEVFGNGKAG